MRQQLATIFDTSFSEDEYTNLSALLPLVISACVTRSSEKEKCVGQIMSLPDAVQASLMQVIQGVMAKYPSLTPEDESLYVDEEESDLSISSGVDDDANETANGSTIRRLSLLSIASVSTPQHSHAVGTPRTPESRVKARRYERENIALIEENTLLKRHIEELEMKVNNNNSLQDTFQMEKEQLRTSWEMKLIEAENGLQKKYKDDMLEKSKEITKLQSKVALQEDALAELETLKDELECSKALANKLAKTEATLVKYKKKLRS